MSNNQNEVKITRAKGRPMLTWVGKRPLTRVAAYPAQLVETFSVNAPSPMDETLWSDWPEKFPRGGLLFHGDNKDVLAHLLANGFRGKVKLIYIDPPFDSGADYVRKVELRGAKGKTKIDGEEYTLGEQIQYTDIWANDNYLQFMYERLLIMRELLSDDGSLYLHCDWHKVHFLRSVLDEIFGSENCRNEIVWLYHRFGLGEQRHYTRAHDNILWYVKDKKSPFNLDAVRIPYSEKTRSNFEQGLGGSGFGSGELNPLGKVPEDFWEIAPAYKSLNEVLPFPTQKPEALLKRMIVGSTGIGDIVLDCFIGSGTTAAVAQKLGRRWIGCDINKGAVQTTAKRLHAVAHDQLARLNMERQVKLIEDENHAHQPAQLSFTMWRVNDYDLQVQHNEAINLACEHIGVTRNRTDGYFDGMLGKRLVKIVPFNHPLTPLDLEGLRQELHQRPEEERDVMLVCLGMELSAKAWIENHNRSRPVNRVHVIELRTDKKYGGFIKHEPLTASISVKRKGDKVLIEIKDVISPTIIQRLNLEQGVFRAQIEDWRAVVDCVMIDSDYNGEVFNVVMSDVPERRQDLVSGAYEVSAPREGATVAVKIIDMLGEEAVITKTV